MYNEQLKREFIGQYTNVESRKQNCIALFNALEPFENVWNADVCTADGENLRRAVDHLVGIRAASKVWRYNILRDYVAWCIQKGVHGASNAIFSVDTDGVSKMRSRTVSSPLHLQMYLDGIFAKESLNTLDNTIRAYCWLAYIGLPEEDAISLRCGDVDLDNMIISYGGREYRICSEAIPCLKRCKEMPFWYYRHPNYPDKATERKRVPGDLLLRGTSGEPSAAVFRHNLSAASKKHAEKKLNGTVSKEDRLYGMIESLRLSYYRIWISGLFYRVFIMEGAGIAPDFSEAASYRLSATQHEFSGKTYNARTLYNKIKSEYLSDYKVWKKAFYQ